MFWTCRWTEEFLRAFVEGLAAFDMDRVASREGFPAPKGDIDVSGIEFKTVCSTAHPFGSHERGAGPRKGIKHDVAPLRAVFDGVGH